MATKKKGTEKDLPDIQTLKIDTLKPYRYNSKKHTEDGIKKLMQSISQYGLVNPITVDKDMIIIGGHGRVEACKRLGWTVIQVQIRDDLSKKGANQLRISENRVTSTEYDSEKAKLELEELNLGDLTELQDIEIEGLGFEKIEIEKLFDDYTEMDNSALTEDLDSDIDEQTKKGIEDIEKMDNKAVNVGVALGFKMVPISSSRHIAKFIASLQDEYNAPADEAFVQFIKEMNEAA